MMTNINYLPVEILVEIFKATQKHGLHLPDYSSVRANALAATTVASVCQHWRRIALDTSILWSYIAFYDDDDITTRMARSRGRLLTLSIYCCDEWEDVLSRCLDQVQHLSINGGEVEDIMDALVQAQTPRLLSLSLEPLPSTNISRIVELKLPDKPNTFSGLRELFLRRVGVICDGAPFGDHLHRVTLERTKIPLAAILSPSASTLTSLTMGPGIHSPWEAVPSPVVFVALQELVLQNVSARITSWMRVPRLKTLKFLVYQSSSFNIFVRSLEHTWVKEPMCELNLIVLEMIGHLAWKELHVPFFLAFPEVKHMHWRVGAPYLFAKTWARVFGMGTYWPELRCIMVVDEGVRSALVEVLEITKRKAAVDMLTISK